MQAASDHLLKAQPIPAERFFDARDEMNLAEFPIALLSDRPPGGVNTLEFHDTVRDPRTKELIHRRLSITAPDKYGLPTACDDEVILGLIQLTKLKNGFTDRTVHFSRYELIRLLGWSLKGASYRRLEESLDRWTFVGLDYEKAWWDNKRKGWVDEKFHILERVSLFENGKGLAERDGQASLPFSSFTWSEIIFRSFQDGYVKRLDLDFFLNLQSPTAKRVYRFLDKHFYHRHQLEYDLGNFAFEHIGLSRVYRTGVLKQKLAPAFEELEAKGFLEPLSPAERYLQVRRGEWKVIFLKKVATEAPQGKDSRRALEKALASRGVTAVTAAELVAAFPPERIAVKIEVFDWLQENNDKRLAKNPAGYLVQSVRNDYQTPQGFEPKDRREQKKQAADERQKKKLEELTAQRRREEAEAAARKAERRHIENYLSRLTTQERQDLEEQALAHADPKMRHMALQGDSFGAVARRLLVDQEVLRVCPIHATAS